MNYVLKNQIKRFRVFLIPSGEGRTKYIKKCGFFREMGDNVFFQPRKLPADPKFVRFHNNIQVASGVTFITHDIMHRVFSKVDLDNTYQSHLGCIEVMDNVFIGAGSIILPDVRIGPNAIVAAGAVVTKDVKEGDVVAGVPAKKVGDFDAVMNKRRIESRTINEADREKRVEDEWTKFYSKRK